MFNVYQNNTVSVHHSCNMRFSALLYKASVWLFRFNIGVFPFAMITSLVLFLPPHLPAAIVAEAMGKPMPIMRNDGTWKGDDGKLEHDNGEDKHGKQVQLFGVMSTFPYPFCGHD